MTQYLYMVRMSLAPWGRPSVPVLSERHLGFSKKRHGGKTQVLLKDLNDDKWYEMTGKKIAE